MALRLTHGIQLGIVLGPRTVTGIVHSTYCARTMHEYNNHCACDKCRWEYSVVGACTFFTKSETPESKSSTKSSNFEAGNGNNNIKLALHTGPRTYYLCYCSIFVAPEAHLLKINAFSWNSLFAQLYRHVNLSVQCDMKLYESRIYPCNKRCIR